jgi:hypothetical protein
MRITAELLREEREQAISVKFQEFMKVYSKQKDALICFFEGYDQVYYNSRIDPIIRSEKAYISCGGKQRVLGLQGKIKKHSFYKKAKVVFFVDRDFDEPLHSDLRATVYETPVYSIENFYVSIEAFARIIGNVFKINKFSENENEAKIYEICLNLYQQTQSDFHKKTTLLNLFVIVLRRKKNLNISGYSLKLLKLNELVRIELGAVEQNYDLEKLNQYYPCAKDVTIDDISDKLLPSDKKFSDIFRGKFEIEFLKSFLLKLKDQLCLKYSSYFPCKKKISFHISGINDELLNDLSQWADTPECLIAFLSQVKSRYFP